MGDQTRQRTVFNFLREHARSRSPFTVPEMAAAVGWKRKTAPTYVSKQYKAYFETVSRGVYRVIPEFRRVTWEEFQDLVTQVRHPFASYNRATFQSVVVFDFLMPLTREDKLRRALDDLFYRDTLVRRIQEIGLQEMERTIRRQLGQSDDEYIAQIITFIGDRIGGFSISHVSARFRTGAILSRQESADPLTRDQPYLIDETTAVVRFIIPCISSKITHDGDFDLTEPTGNRAETINREVQQIRTIFFELFVEALVPTIRGEKLIWMLETSPGGQRLYELALMEPNTKVSVKSIDDEDEDADIDEADDE